MDQLNDQAGSRTGRHKRHSHSYGDYLALFHMPRVKHSSWLLAGLHAQTDDLVLQRRGPVFRPIWLPYWWASNRQPRVAKLSPGVLY